MFNINFLGSPGIQPDVVNSYISYRPEDEKNIKNIIVNEKPGFFTKIIDYVPTKSDYISFSMLCIIIVLFIYIKPIKKKSFSKKNIYNVLDLNSMNLNEDYLMLKNIINHIKDNEEITLLKISSTNSVMNFKFKSMKGIKSLKELSKDFRNKYGLNSRFQGDNASNYVLSLDAPWKVYDDSTGVSKIQNFGKSSYILFIIEDLIKQKKLHKGNLRIDIKDKDDYFIKFYPAHHKI